MGVRMRMARGLIKRFITAPTLSHCERECMTARDFNCRSFNYRRVLVYTHLYCNVTFHALNSHWSPIAGTLLICYIIQKRLNTGTAARVIENGPISTKQNRWTVTRSVRFIVDHVIIYQRRGNGFWRRNRGRTMCYCLNIPYLRPNRKLNLFVPSNTIIQYDFYIIRLKNPKKKS